MLSARLAQKMVNGLAHAEEPTKRCPKPFGGHGPEILPDYWPWPKRCPFSERWNRPMCPYNCHGFCNRYYFH